MNSMYKYFHNKNILITGGLGFLGTRITRALSIVGANVVIVDNLITGKKPYEEDNGVKIIYRDISKPLDLNLEDVDYIFHMAGIASPQQYLKNAVKTLDVSYLGTKNVLDIARDHKAKVLYFSSSEIYGNPPSEQVPTKESYFGNVSSIGDRACYDEGKRIGEALCSVYYRNYGVETVIVRPFNVYGPGLQINDFRVIPNFIRDALSNNPLQIYGNGEQTRTYCYLEDAIDGFFRAIKRGKSGEVYNIGNPKPEISVIQLAEVIKKVTQKYRKKDIQIIKTPYPDNYPSDEPSRRCPDISKAIKDLGYQPMYPLESGLKDFTKWAIQNWKFVI